MLLPARLLAPRAGRDDTLARAALHSLPSWLDQLLGGSLLGLAQAATENRQQVKPDIWVAAEDPAQHPAEFR